MSTWAEYNFPEVRFAAPSEVLTGLEHAIFERQSRAKLAAPPENSLRLTPDEPRLEFGNMTTAFLNRLKTLAMYLTGLIPSADQLAAMHTGTAARLWVRTDRLPVGGIVTRGTPPSEYCWSREDLFDACGGNPEELFHRWRFRRPAEIVLVMYRILNRLRYGLSSVAVCFQPRAVFLRRGCGFSAGNVNGDGTLLRSTASGGTVPVPIAQSNTATAAERAAAWAAAEIYRDEISPDNWSSGWNYWTGAPNFGARTLYNRGLSYDNFDVSAYWLLEGSGLCLYCSDDGLLPAAGIGTLSWEVAIRERNYPVGALVATVNGALENSYSEDAVAVTWQNGVVEGLDLINSRIAALGAFAAPDDAGSDGNPGGYFEHPGSGIVTGGTRHLQCALNGDERIDVMRCKEFDFDLND